MKLITTLVPLIGALILFRSGDLHAQVQPMRFEPLTVEDGLSDGSVTSITQDQPGFMWFGTLAGLNKVDGYADDLRPHPSSDSVGFLPCDDS